MRIHSALLSIALAFIAVIASIVPMQAHAATKSFNMTAQQYSFSPSSITVEEGDTVNLSIKSVDVDHGFSIAEFGVNTTLSAGKTTSVSFTADKVGTYTFFCSVYCGSGHASMTGTLVVKEAGSGGESEESDDSDDSTAPSISSIGVSEPDGDTITITWTTDEAAKGQVEYGTSEGTYIAATPEEGDTGTSHSATLTGLSPDTTYYYRVKSTDEAGNLARSSESSFSSEEEKTCDDLECTDEEKCEDVDGEPTCVSNDASCDDIECDEGEHCEVQEPEGCEGDDCEAEAQCISDEEEDSQGDSSVSITSIQTNTGTYTTTSSNITLTDGEQITMSGTADPEAEIGLEFCCATTRYTVRADGSGNWTFEGVPPLDTGDNYVKVYDKSEEDKTETIDFEVIAEGETPADANANANEETEDGSGGSGGWVIGLIIAGLIIVVFAGFMFMRQIRR